MRRLNDSIAVKASASFAIGFVKTFFLERGPQGSAKLALRFPLPNILIDGLLIEKAVILELQSRQLEGPHPTLSIGWNPAKTRALPSFAGTLLAIEKGEGSCRLGIEGGYTAPGGIAGAVFDAIVGVRIARATLSALLTEFKTGIEADYLTRLAS